MRNLDFIFIISMLFLDVDLSVAKQCSYLVPLSS